MKLNSLQRKILERHRHNYRFCYNKAIGILNERNNNITDTRKILEHYEEDIEQKSSYSNNYSKYDLRNLIIPEKCNSRTPWLLKTGYAIREQAVFEAYKNYDTNINNIQNGIISRFNLGFKKKKSSSWTFNINKQNITQYENGFSLYKETGIIKTKEKFKINHNCKIHFDGINYFILVPYIKEIKQPKNKKYFCALDPGSRKFQTIYSEEESICIGDRASSKLYGLLLQLDKAISKKQKFLQRKLRIRIENLQKELHNKTSRFLCENYKNIVIPKLTKNNDIIKKGTKLKTKTVRNMVVLGHCKFVELLKIKADEYTDVQVNDKITEEYTSQVCPKCNKLTKTTKEIYECKYCHYMIDRDLLGSRNILLKSWNLLKINN